MLKCLIDTDILSEIGKGVDRHVRENAIRYLDEHQILTFTSISVYEVLYGLRSKVATKQAQRFLMLASAHEEIVPDSDDYRLAAEIRAQMQLAGTEIGKADPIIAACALRRDLTMVTGNMKHYQFVADAGFPLRLSNWRNAVD
ncbi:MAG: PIN domain-containing protein [Armatimonadetes bacterium]|nr:PIN domain-containing protein [Armatimonadota bacterium]